MGEVAVTVAKWALKITFFASIAISLMIIIGLLTTYLVVGFNMSILSDIFALVQIWLPFNLNVLLLWIAVAATTFLTYRVSLMAYNLINSYLRG